MKTLIQAAIVFQLVAISPALAQQQTEDEQQQIPVTTSPEVWIYQQELRRYNDPQTAVRRKAEIAAAQRRRRIAARKWFGFSNARPIANPTPYGSMYSPGWISNSGRQYGWSGTSQFLLP